MKGRLFAVMIAAVSASGCGDSETEAGRHHAAILAKLKATEKGIESQADVSAALEKYGAATTEIQAFLKQHPGTPEAEELAQALQWLEVETARLQTIQEASQPPPDNTPDFYNK